MSDPENHRQVVRGLFELAFNGRQPAQAAARYIGSPYIQHNPHAPDGAAGFVSFIGRMVEQNPLLSLEIKRMLADGDLVMAHSLMRTSPADRGTALVDIFRVKDGKVVEHWDIAQAVPETSANDNTMF